MSHPLKKRICDAVWDFAVTALIAVSLALLWSLTLTGPGGESRIVLTAVLSSLVISAVDHALDGKVRLLAFCGLAALAFLFGLLRVGPVFEMVQSLRALVLYWQGAGGALALYADDLRMLLGAAAVLISCSQTMDDAFGTAVFTYALLAAVCFVLCQYPNLPIHVFSVREGVSLLLPGIGGLLMILSAHEGRTLRALPAAAFLTALAFFLMPSQGTMTEPLASAAREVSDFFQTVVVRTERDGFSLSAAGYGGNGDRLGGKANPGKGKVLRVSGTAGESLYLRGYTCDTYTGSQWVDRLSDGGSLFSFAGVRRDRLFDMTKDTGAETETITVHALADASSTIFAPQRIRAFTGLSAEMGLYYNEATELFLARNLVQGDEYRIAYVPLEADDAAVQALERANADSADPQWAEVTDRYLTVPGYMPAELYDLAYEAAGSGTPLEKAVHIRDWLAGSYTYTLNAAEVPENQDFIVWFLLREKKGYCTYFASAMTMLCRMNGIPARFAAGYHTVLSEDGTAEVMQSDAHAWTEIYLNGVGWLTIDATPGNGGGTRSVRTSSPTGTTKPTAAPTPAPTLTPDARSDQTPEPTEKTAPDESGGNTPSPESGPTVTPSPTPEGQRGLPSTAPTESAAPVPAARGTGGEPGRSLWWLLLILIALLAFFAVRIVLTNPVRRADRHPEKAGIILMEESIRTLRAMKRTRTPGETWAAYGLRLSEERFPPAEEAFRQYSASIYGHETVQRAAAESLYDSVWDVASVFVKLRRAVARVFSFRS